MTLAAVLYGLLDFLVLSRRESGGPDLAKKSQIAKGFSASAMAKISKIEIQNKKSNYQAWTSRIESDWDQDPFTRYNRPKTKKKVQQIDEVPHRILTPLEELNITQLKLVATLNKDSGSLAMVQESSGKGYLVSIGTYIGQNSGQVVKIEQDKLVIQELVKDSWGNVVERLQEMKFNKLDDKG